MQSCIKVACFQRCFSVSSHLCQDYLSSSSDLQEVLQLDPNVLEAEQELEVVTALLRQSLMENAAKVKHTHLCLT